jgi:MoxR-like ATPase
MSDWSYAELSEEIDEVRERIHSLRRTLSHFFVGKQELVDLMILSASVGEPLLIVGPPGTAKSDLVLKFCQGLGMQQGYFEYMLTKFTEPSEILGPIDIELLKKGRFVRKIEGKLPTAKVAFLDEIFKSNSAILNVLLTIINERKFYQDGVACQVPLNILFAATNEVPEFKELDALKDRFVLKVRSSSVQDFAFDELIDRGVENEALKIFGSRPWADRATLEDFEKIRRYLDLTVAGHTGEKLAGEESPVSRDRERFFPREVSDLFRRLLRTLAKEEKLFISDRKVVKLYKFLRMRAFLFHGGEVRKEDLSILRHIGERESHFTQLPEKVDRLLGLA